MSLSGGAAARRARPIYRVFVSSTWLDLQPERRALMEALNRMEEMRFVGMEFFGNRPDDTHDASIDQVDLCEVFVGIIGHRYGSGITEAEYRRARALNLPCFVYFKRGDTVRPELTDNDPGRAARLVAFKEELLRGHTVKEFASADELAASATADLHNWVAARWISTGRVEATAARAPGPAGDIGRTNLLRLLERVDHDWIKGVLEASLHHRAWLELGLDWREDAVEHPWDRIVVAPNRPIQTLGREDSIAGIFDDAQHTLLVLGEPGAGKTTTVLELARDLIGRARQSPAEPAPVVLALSTWQGQGLAEWLLAELGLRYQVPKRVAKTWLEEGRLVLILDGLDEVGAERREACVAAINAFEQEHHPPGLAVTCRVAEYEALTAKLRLRSAICLQPLTPAQVDRYFEAAGAALEPLRHALREDEGLRELARSPLMLSVMALAWRGPAGTTAPFAAAQTAQARRQHLFGAYIDAALARRGKAAGDYEPARIVAWLAWLARRMQEHGQSLFALEQLQPGWIAGGRSQFGYMLVTRLAGCLALVLPILFWKTPLVNRLVCVGLAAGTGLALGVIDFLFLRVKATSTDMGSRRFWIMLGSLAGLGAAWVFVGVDLLERLKQPDPAVGYGFVYLCMVAFAFCAPVDVKALDIKTTDTMSWSWRLALARFGVGIMGLNLLIALVFSGTVIAMSSQDGWQAFAKELSGAWFLGGMAAGAIAGFAGARFWRKGRFMVVLWVVAGAALGGQAGGLVTRWDNGAFIAVMLEFFLAAFIGVFGGFVAGMIDPVRARRSGVGFWLRVPLTAFAVVGALMTIPGIVTMIAYSGDTPAPWRDQVLATFIVGVGAGLVAFFRFGGFNGLQHGVLRWLLVRGGHLPPKAEKFFNHAAQLALLQKVGFGYRFIHALLLDHFAGLRGPGKG